MERLSNHGVTRPHIGTARETVVMSRAGQYRQLARDGKTKSGAAEALRSGGIGLDKFFE